jgi:hypothetical protein
MHQETKQWHQHNRAIIVIRACLIPAFSAKAEIILDSCYIAAGASSLCTPPSRRSDWRYYSIGNINTFFFAAIIHCYVYSPSHDGIFWLAGATIVVSILPISSYVAWHWLPATYVPAQKIRTIPANKRFLHFGHRGKTASCRARLFTCIGLHT